MTQQHQLHDSNGTGGSSSSPHHHELHLSSTPTRTNIVHHSHNSSQASVHAMLLPPAASTSISSVDHLQEEEEQYKPLMVPTTYGSTQQVPQGNTNPGFLAVDDDATSFLSTNTDESTTQNKTTNLRKLAMDLSLYFNLFIVLVKAIAYLQTLSLSVLAALLDSVLDVVSQWVLQYTESHSSLTRSSAVYPAGSSRMEPIGVLTCAALMGMASFEVVKESATTLIFQSDTLEDATLQDEWLSLSSMMGIVVVKALLYGLCQHASHSNDPTLQALALDHFNDALSNGMASIALLACLYSGELWFVDPVGAILISVYIIWSWYHTGKEQIEQLTGKCAPDEFLDELMELAANFDDRMMVDTLRAYHFGPKFLVELEVVLPKHTLLVESHDLGMELQYEIEGREEVERCFVHIDYSMRDYDEHVVSKVPELREQLLRNRKRAQFQSHASI